ncbi:MAG: SMP-30/gluconolactonase/LRE family protein [Candidatus Promineifilaceae bacterium]
MKTTVLVDNLKFPESPRWHDGRLWFCDYAANRVMNVDLKGNLRTVVELPDLPTAIDWTPDGRLLVVSATARRLLRLEDGELAPFADLSEHLPYACGELVVDRQGRAYMGNLGFDFGAEAPAAANSGSIWLVGPEGHAQLAAGGFGFPNGMVITPDGQTLIVADSYGACLTAFHIEPGGLLSERRAWAQFDDSISFEEGRFTPDGICLDAEGAVWVAALNEVLRLHEGAQVVERVPVDHYALACTLGGPERRTLFILTTEALNPADSEARGRIEIVQVEVAGAGRP